MSFRYDMMFGPKVMRPESVVLMDTGYYGHSRIGGMDVRESMAATKPAWRVVKSHPRARRKRYTVQRYEQPAAFIIDGVLVAHPLIIEQLRREFP